MRIPLVLASASPARLATLRSAGVEPRVIISDVDEDAVLADALARNAQAHQGGLDPADAVLALARAKCEDVAAHHQTDALVLGCDSMLELDNAIMGKPGNAEKARERWLTMRGRTGTLHTGHWMVDDRDGGTGATFGKTSSTVVHFADLSDAEVEAYVATGEPLHVAGAFTVDGLGGPYVTAIEGDYHGVVGVSLPLVRQMLGDIGIEFHRLRAEK